MVRINMIRITRYIAGDGSEWRTVREGVLNIGKPRKSGSR